jgi:ribosomal-protein-alanine N-acetyltransferase
VVCDTKGHVLAYLILKEKKGGGEVLIEIMAVDKSHRRVGIGTCILCCAKAFAVGKRAKRLFLHVRGSNTEAQGLYRKNGFTVTNTPTKPYRDGKTPADHRKIEMELLL